MRPANRLRNKKISTTHLRKSMKGASAALQSAGCADALGVIVGRQSGGVEIAVEDDGPDFPEHQLSRVGERFARGEQDCELPPDADEALHHIIGPLLQDASALKADPQRLDAIARMRKALDQYAQQFDDPGFPEAAAD